MSLPRISFKNFRFSRNQEIGNPSQNPNESSQNLEASITIEEEKEICPICLEDLDGKVTRRLKKCKHKFCHNCVTKLAKSFAPAQEPIDTLVTCPLCRAQSYPMLSKRCIDIFIRYTAGLILLGCIIHIILALSGAYNPYYRG